VQGKVSFNDGRLVQELTFDNVAATNAGLTFRTDAPVLGLGEGAQQFDRRGALYPTRWRAKPATPAYP